MNENISKSVKAMLEQRKEQIAITNVSESFGEYALSENASRIRNKINELIKSESCSLIEMNDIITDIRESNFSETTQRILVKKIFDVYNESDSSEEILDENIDLIGSLRFDGDPVKNAEYIALLREMEKFVSHIVDLLESDFELADDLLEILEDHAKKDKKKEDLDRCLSACLNRIDRGNKKFDSNLYKEYYNKFVKFNRISKSFNNRYSKITMAEKKIIDEKFDKILGNLYTGIVRDWFFFKQFGNKCPKTERLNEAFTKLKEVDRDSAIVLAQRVINPMYNYIAKCWSNTVNNVGYMRRILGIELEDSAKWKIVHKIFK